MLSCDIHGKISTYKCSLALTYFFYFVILLNWPSWPWSYGSWIYNYPCNQCISPLMLWVRFSIRSGYTTLDKVCQWLATGQWFSPGIPVSSTNKTDRHDIIEILLKATLSTIKQTNTHIIRTTTWPPNILFSALVSSCCLSC